MKPIPSMKSKLLAYSFAAVLLGATSLVSVASAATDDAIIHTAGSVSYVSGGVGDESISRLNSLASDFNLKLVFALKSGAYASDVRVVIANAKGTTLLDTLSEGPWFLTRLPTGNYQIVATFAGNSVKRQVSVGTAKLNTVDFRWSSE